MMVEEQYEQLADQAVSSYLTAKVPLNTSILKIAEEHDFNPEQVKRLVEMSNTKTFLKLFGQEENKNTPMEFPVADAGEVLKSFYEPGAEGAAAAPHPGGGEGDPNQFLGDCPDDMGDMRRGLPLGSMPQDGGEVKVASETFSSQPDPHVTSRRLRKVASDLLNRVHDEEFAYTEGVIKIAAELRKDGTDFEAFEKEAYFAHGADSQIIREDIRRAMNCKAAPLDTAALDSHLEKCASLVIEGGPLFKAYEQLFMTKVAQKKWADGVRIARDALKRVNQCA